MEVPDVARNSCPLGVEPVEPFHMAGVDVVGKLLSEAIEGES